MQLIVLSHYQAQPLLDAHISGQTRARISLDLNLTQSDVVVNADGVTMPDEQHLAWSAIKAIAASENGCFPHRGQCSHKDSGLFRANQPHLLALPHPARADDARLRPAHAPHQGHRPAPRHAGQDQGHRAHTRPGADTCTGLGYTAIEAAKLADEVITIELDPAAQTICHSNPWSQPLFGNPKIKLIIGDSTEEVSNFQMRRSRASSTTRRRSRSAATCIRAISTLSYFAF